MICTEEFSSALRTEESFWNRAQKKLIQTTMKRKQGTYNFHIKHTQKMQLELECLESMSIKSNSLHAGCQLNMKHK
jgi:hypothetical protein